MSPPRTVAVFLIAVRKDGTRSMLSRLFVLDEIIRGTYVPWIPS
jgi:hypothetical protein